MKFEGQNSIDSIHTHSCRFRNCLSKIIYHDLILSFPWLVCLHMLTAYRILKLSEAGVPRIAVDEFLLYAFSRQTCFHMLTFTTYMILKLNDAGVPCDTVDE